MGIARVKYPNGRRYARSYSNVCLAYIREVFERGAVELVWTPRGEKYGHRISGPDEESKR